MRNRRTLFGVLVTAALVTSAGLLGASAQAAEPDPDETVAWKLPGLTGKQATSLESDGYDLVDYHADGSAIVIGDAETAEKLRDRGLEPKFHDTVYKPIAKGYKDTADTYYGGYHTVTAHEEHLDKVASEHADLAKVYDVGDSWLKTQGQGGHDIKAICITKIADGDCEQSPDSAKPRFSLVAQMHAREIATGEVAWKFIDKLTSTYGSDEAVTKLLDTTEVWVVPIANPDGVDVVASGGDDPVLQRKNLNTSAGGCGDSGGVDLNRNSSFQWGGDSDDPCSETFQGSAAKSEPETAGLEKWFESIHPDQREDDPSAPAPADARDTMITLHSYGNYIIVPWGYTEDKAPNDGELRALGAKMAESNGYFVGTNGDTVGYSTSGTTDDFTYGKLGVASFTFEMGGDSGDCGGFLPVYECVDSTLWKENEGALMTAAESAKAPYAE